MSQRKVLFRRRGTPFDRRASLRRRSSRFLSSRLPTECGTQDKSSKTLKWLPIASLYPSRLLVADFRTTRRASETDVITPHPDSLAARVFGATVLLQNRSCHAYSAKRGPNPERDGPHRRDRDRRRRSAGRPRSGNSAGRHPRG